MLVIMAITLSKDAVWQLCRNKAGNQGLSHPSYCSTLLDFCILQDCKKATSDLGPIYRTRKRTFASAYSWAQAAPGISPAENCSAHAEPGA